MFMFSFFVVSLTVLLPLLSSGARIDTEILIPPIPNNVSILVVWGKLDFIINRKAVESNYIIVIIEMTGRNYFLIRLL